MTDLISVRNMLGMWTDAVRCRLVPDSTRYLVVLLGALIVSTPNVTVAEGIFQASEVSDAQAHKLQQLVGPDFTVSATVELPNTLAGKDEPYEVIAALICEENNDRLMLRMFDGRIVVGQVLDGEYSSVGADVSLSAGGTYHVVALFSGDTIKLYLNGKHFATETRSRPMAKWSAIELSHWRGGNPFKGNIRKLSVFSQALSEAEIGRLYSDSSIQTNPVVVAPDIVKASYDKYPALRIGDDVVRPLSVGFGPAVSVVNWDSSDRLDLLLGGVNGRGFGVRLALYRQTGQDARGLPVFDAGQTLDLPGAVFTRIDRADHRFDLIAGGLGTALGPNHLICYQDVANSGEPDWGTPYPVLIGGQSLREAVGGSRYQWAVGDVTEDGIPDLLVSTTEGNRNDYWPDSLNMWSGIERVDSGKGRGFDIEGNWLGSRINTRLYWAEGRYGADGHYALAGLKPVHNRHLGFQVQWKTYADKIVPSAATIDGQRVLLLMGALDRVLALPYELVEGELVCAEAQPLLKDGEPITDVNHTGNIDVADLDGDGRQEVLVAGNPGRVAVLKGSKIGEFLEVGPLQGQGGYLEVDNLAIPSLFDWNKDGYEDLIVGDAAGRISLWPGTAERTVYGAPTWFTTGGEAIHHQAGASGSIQGPNEARWGYTQPEAGIWGDSPAIITNDVSGQITVYRPNGTSSDLSGHFMTLDGEPLEVAWRVKPTIISGEYGLAGDSRDVLLLLDWDGDLAYVIPSKDGGLQVDRIVKVIGADGAPLRLCGPSGDWGRTKLTICDWDEDGRWDVLAGVVPRNYQTLFKHIEHVDQLSGSQVFWFRNVGTNDKPRLEAASLIKPKEGPTFDFGWHCASPWPTDVTGDGHVDLLIGAEDGKVYWFNREELTW